MKSSQTCPRKYRGVDSLNGPSTAKGKGGKFAEQPKISSARFQIDDERKKTDVTTEAQYLREPPAGENLLEAVLVLPERHMLLRELSESSSFDTIKTEKGVWIKHDKRNVLHIYSRTMWSLQEGFKAVNWALHDMRLAQQNVATLFLVQKPMDAGTDTLITVDLDSRPRVGQRQKTMIGTAEVATDVLRQLGTSFLSSTTTLQAIKRSLRMHVDFGHVIIRRRKRGIGNAMSYSDFTEMALQYGAKGGAELNTRVAEVGYVSKLVAHLLDPQTNVSREFENITYKDSIHIRIGDQIFTGDVGYTQGRLPNLTNSRLVVSEEWPPLRWIIVAPDRKYDWALQVDSDLLVQPIPELIECLLKDIVVCTEGPPKNPADLEHRCVNINVKNPDKWIGKLSEIGTKSSALIPFRDTPFVVEISRNFAWRDVNTKEALHSWTGIQILGRHWEDSLNYKSMHESKKDWGPHQSHIWAGSGETAEDQFAGFVCHVLEILSALEVANVDGTAT
ncbi:hypothetical protein MHUMG1_05568 [Metarhizium humberi]|uniref:Uncharacterized protein n=1 Tax=Metarhizium humberi TaxID=2596975 RepID=A0A9P8MAA7_9HYPO|nr:hypothetical protein MHUMG1_05568 [Metarhizium humberi]